MPKRAFITGISGMDGALLSELLLGKGYEVHGLLRRSSVDNTERLKRGCGSGRPTLHYGDLTDGTGLTRLLLEIQPEEVYNLGALSHVRISYECPEYTADVTGVGTVRLLEALRTAGLAKTVRYYQASSSEMFGGLQCPPTGYTEKSPFHPRSPYGCAKVFAYNTTVNYRESYEIHASNGILFNHEHPTRGENFVTRKIAKAVAEIEWGITDHVALGNLDARRDWGWSPDFVLGMWQMLQQPEPDDYVLATGMAHSVEDFCEAAFAYRGLNWREFVIFDEALLRPAEVNVLIGDARKAQQKLGWRPTVEFGEIVKKLVDAELEAIENGTAL